ncbi:NAD(P)H-hydrate dehydratase [uncultured Shimia sp.]|uniref:NAD(P)H-hydrate dehydratase n=1 Tax=uncultured Shimia sp. TaxID=573152 RepID=UPI002629F4EC|nr:NAD(P)H-hydrate dehydratase [uncultured Shimia sp.]
MTELLTAAQMRAIETAEIESGEVTGLELMERAGRGVVEAIFEEWPELAKTSHRAVVLCGPGNNGGDGFVVARLLKEWGWEVEVFLYGDAEKLPPDAQANYERWCEMGDVGALPDAPKFAHEADLYVDAIFGTGLVRPLDGTLLEWAKDRASDPYAAAKTVAVDIASGLCSDSGHELSDGTETVLAGLTVSFHREKLGHYLNWGPSKGGKVVIVDIGLKGGVSPDEEDAKRPPRGGQDGLCPTVSPGEIVRIFDGPTGLLGKAGTHKFIHGHALIVSGGAGKSGAARLAARGALRIGTGLVTLGVPHEAQAEVAAQITALMMCEFGDAGALAKTLEDDRLNALCLGPGLGLERARALVPVALATGRATVLDADALSAFADDPEALFDMLHKACVLTPHEGEFKRLFPDIHAKLVEVPAKGPAYSKVDATREAAQRAGCVVLFKGPDTVISDPKGQCSINSAHYDRAAPWLATAGSGDVLAGFITGLLARGFQPLQATTTAAWLHVECALEFGPGLIAEDLPEQLPAVFRKLEV